VLSKRLSKSRPGQGVVGLQHTARKQDGTVVATVVRDSLMRCRP
jgi:acyl dehydratase